MSPLCFLALSLSSITLSSFLRLFSLPTALHFPADIYFLSYILFSIPIHYSSCTSFLIFQPPFTHPSFHRPKVISTGRPSMRIQCWRLRGAGSWNSSSLSSLSPKASSHLKVSATSEVRSQAHTKGVISFLSIHVCDWVVCLRLCNCVWDCVYKAIISTVLDLACYCLMIC